MKPSSASHHVAPVHRIDQAGLVRELSERCGLRRGQTLIVHASLRAVGYVEGGAEAVVRALQETVGPEGTLLMPSFTAPAPDGRFDVRRAPSRTGLITETFRTMPGVRRSLHPTHSVAVWGRLANACTEDHLATGGLGLGSPFHRAAEADAQVLMIGCDLRSCSLIHVAEAIVRPAYLGRVWYPGGDRPLTVIDAAGREQLHQPIDPPTDSQGFVAVQSELDRRGALSRVGLGQAHCLLFRGREGLSAAVALLRADPAALLCRADSCRVCNDARQIIGAAQPIN